MGGWCLLARTVHRMDRPLDLPQRQAGALYRRGKTMLTYTLHSKRINRTITFSRPGKSAVYVDMTPDQKWPGTLGEQLCEGGKREGDTISFCGKDQDDFKKLCRKWLRAFYANR